MTIGYFGNYNPAHPRNMIFLECLRLAGFEVVEINYRGPRVKKYIRMISELRAKRSQIDCLIVGFPGQQAMLVAKIFYRGPIVFNVLLSLYDAVIVDRRRYPRYSIRALYFWLLDYISARLPNRLVLDCMAYMDYFEKNFKIRPQKMARVFLGADEDIFRPLNLLGKNLEIHYYSSYIPTHGTDTIVRAAKLLENEGVKFILSGRGQCYEQTRELADALRIENVEFIERMGSQEELNNFINTSWVSLGIFGLRPRTGRIIGSKVFEALACGRPVITSETAAGKEFLSDAESVLFVRPEDPVDLAEKILLLKRDEALRQKIAAGGRLAYEKNASFAAIAKELKNLIMTVCQTAK